ncbi:unnamed protein product [Prunus armeniaca]
MLHPPRVLRPDLSKSLVLPLLLAHQLRVNITMVGIRNVQMTRFQAMSHEICITTTFELNWKCIKEYETGLLRYRSKTISCH